MTFFNKKKKEKLLEIKPRLSIESSIGERFKKGWYKYSSNSLSLVGLVLVILLIFTAIFAKKIVPYPEHAGLVVQMDKTYIPPGAEYFAGTDEYGRDVFSRMIIGLRYSLGIGVLVLLLAVPFGVLLGLLAGYYKDRFIGNLIMRFTELFMSIPPLILALVVCTMFSPNYFFAAVGIATAWWPWYTRLSYNLVTSLSNELYIKYATIAGASMLRITTREMLPNITTPIITKMSLDMGSIIIIASSMSFVGLGVQPPAPSLGSMVSSGISYLPEFWWLSIMPAGMVILIVLGFNLLGDGLSDVLALEDN